MNRELVKPAKAESRKHRRELTQRLNELLTGARNRQNLFIEAIADPADRMHSRVDQDFVAAQLDSQCKLIHDIESALDKIAQGEDRSCESCNRPIPLTRLNAVPWARRCIKCQLRQEAATERQPTAFSHAA